jgi:hypothetical protein
MIEPVSLSEDQIRAKAYELWEARGRVNGYDMEDWFAAETILKQIEHCSKILYPPCYSYITKTDILNRLHISHEGIDDFLRPSISWIEIAAHPETIFECDRNRALHFEEGFLCTCYRIFKDINITYISREHHFPYKDLVKFRKKNWQLVDMYCRGENLPPPLFFYPAPYQLEILDGVHRCLAAYELVQCRKETSLHFSPAFFIVWLGFDRNFFSASIVAHQLLVRYIYRIRFQNDKISNIGQEWTEAYDHK